MGRVMEVSISGYYAWRKRVESHRDRQNRRLLTEIKAIHQQSDKSYGSPRIHKALKAMGYGCGRHRVARLMRSGDLKPRQRKRFKVTTDSKHRLPVAQNVLNRGFAVKRPNEVLASNITYIWTQEGWLYLAVVMDLFSRRIVGWSMRRMMEKDLVIEAFKMAKSRRTLAAGFIHHSDRGVQYASQAYRRLLNQTGGISSMSRKGNCWDNAPLESFFSTLKRERVHHRRYRTRAEARTDIFDYIEGWYNRKRLHSTLGYVSPAKYEEMHNQLTTSIAA